MKPIKSDVIIVGSGVAGLSFAIKLAKRKPHSKISVLSKAGLALSNSHFAQGGIATVTQTINDTFTEHINDTIKSGAGLSDPSIVKLVIETAPDRLNELVEYGMDFTLNKDGNFDLGLEGGHSKPRVVHKFDNTGEHLINTLIRQAQSFENISFFTHRFCIEILKTETGEAKGVSALNTLNQEIELFTGKFIVLATGGSGQVYKNTTNPSVATGDGVAMGIKIGATISNLNFVQFHPTVLYEKKKEQLDLLSEAIRGYGGHVVDKNETQFLFKTDARGELATRDIVSKAIFNELKESGERCVYLDCRHLDPVQFKSHFPKITANLASKGFDVSTHLIPIVPAAHYQCGGLKVNEFGETNIPGLFALGECAETGLHGANRLASNSLLEGLVFAHESAEFISLVIDDIPFDDSIQILLYKVSLAKDDLFLNVKEDIKMVMTNGATIASEIEGLNLARIKLDNLTAIFETKELIQPISKISLETHNLWVVASEIVQSKIKYFKNKRVYANHIQQSFQTKFII